MLGVQTLTALTCSPPTQSSKGSRDKKRDGESNTASDAHGTPIIAKHGDTQAPRRVLFARLSWGQPLSYRSNVTLGQRFVYLLQISDNETVTHRWATSIAKSLEATPRRD